MKYVEVAVSLPIFGLFTYRIPDGVNVEVGHAVLAPFGKQTIAAYVIRLTEETKVEKVKPFRRLLDVRPAFDKSMLPFFQWIAKYYQCNLGEVISTALPKSYSGKVVFVVHATEKGITDLAQNKIPNDNRALLLREIISKPMRTKRGLIRRMSAELEKNDVLKALKGLEKNAWITWVEKEQNGPKAMIKVVALKGTPDHWGGIKGSRMRAAIQLLYEAKGPMDLRDLVAMEGPTIRSALTRLSKKGLVEFSERPDTDSAIFNTLPAKSKPFPLNEQQQAALEGILSKPNRTHLLHGVTGSGKTEVYLHAAANQLKKGKQALILVPEIALTPLLIGRFRARFGNKIAALHSALTQRDRLREWRRIRCGEATIAVGARSALFAPFPNLGLIVVDEEHDDSYKQGDGLRYNARDLAVVRGHIENCPVVLGSATPNIESWENARNGKYGWHKLSIRATARPVPNIELIDMRKHPPDKIISPELELALNSCFEKGEQAIVLYNRRGYANIVECSSCGAHYSCPSCGINLVLHQKSRKLSCHYCGFHQPYQSNCPHCSVPFDIIGHGTERVEEDLQKLFPQAKILRMDADTVATKGAHHAILDAFRQGQANLLVGTQIVAKGHDFPGVTLSAVVGVDHVLNLPDFRSAERTHALVTQLAGRAGRGGKAGTVLVQTRHPEHYVFRLLQDEKACKLNAFYQSEIKHRRVMKHPPASRLTLIRLEGEDRMRVRTQALSMVRSLKTKLPKGIDVLGPSLAPMSKLVGRWRFQIVLRGDDPQIFRKYLNQRSVDLLTTVQHGVRVSMDVDPRSLM